MHIIIDNDTEERALLNPPIEAVPEPASRAERLAQRNYAQARLIADMLQLVYDTCPAMNYKEMEKRAGELGIYLDLPEEDVGPPPFHMFNKVERER